jgi:hypothetical protein
MTGSFTVQSPSSCMRLNSRTGLRLSRQKCLVIFLSRSIRIPGKHLETGHNHFHQNPLHVTVPNHTIIFFNGFKIATETASLNNQKVSDNKFESNHDVKCQPDHQNCGSCFFFAP